MVSIDGTLGGPTVSRCLRPSISWAGRKDWGERGITQNYPNITQQLYPQVPREGGIIRNLPNVSTGSIADFIARTSFNKCLVWVNSSAVDLKMPAQCFCTMPRKQSFVAWAKERECPVSVSFCHSVRRQEWGSSQGGRLPTEAREFYPIISLDACDIVRDQWACCTEYSSSKAAE